jgi:uncharacterized membrane protein
MSTRQPLPRRAKSQGFWIQQYRLLRFYLVTGLMVWVPLIVTVWLTWWLFSNVGLGIENVIRTVFEELREFGSKISWLSFLEEVTYKPGMGFIGALFLFLITGILTRYLVGMRMIGYGERILNNIPFVRNVYRAVQQIRDVFVSREGAVFQEVCVVEYPRKGIYAVAFVTSREDGVIQEKTGQELISVFLPTTPNPTSGFLLYLSAEEVTLLSITVEDAMKMIISGGAYLPEQQVKGLRKKTAPSALDVPV